MAWRGLTAGHLVWVTVAGEILAAPFDVNARRLTGRAVRVDTGVFTLPGNESYAYAALSANGQLVYHDRSGSAQLVMRTRDGQVTPLLSDTLAFEFPRLSPDGRRIAVTVADRDSRLGSVWVLDRDRRILTRVTPPSSEEQRDRQEWSADGRALLYPKASPSGISVGIRPVEGGDERVLASSAVPFNENMMAGDGRTLLARVNDLDGQQSTAGRSAIRPRRRSFATPSS